MSKKISISLVALATGIASLALATSVFAANTGHYGPGMMGARPAVVGTVSSVSGDTIVVQSKGFGQNSTTTDYSVDATSATVTKNGATSSVTDIAIGDMVAVQGTVSGTNVTATSIRDGMMQQGMRPGTVGTVSAINGTTITITSKSRTSGGATTTYTVDASGATVTKNGAASSVSAIAVGDMVSVQGTVSGTSITATSIRDGMGMGARPQGQTIQGNGQPVVAGTVTAVNGSTITITNNNGASTYTIDATSATIQKAGVTNPTISNIAVGDSVIVQGTVNGTSVTATTVIDHAPKAANPSATSNGSKNNNWFPQLFGGIGSFFKNLFKF